MSHSRQQLSLAISVTLTCAIVGCARSTIIGPTDEEIAFSRLHDANVNGYTAAAKGFRLEIGRWPEDESELISFADRWQISLGAQPQKLKFDSLTDGTLYVTYQLKTGGGGVMVPPTPLTPAERQEAPLLVEYRVAH